MKKSILPVLAASLLSLLAVPSYADLTSSTTNAYLRGDFNGWGKLPMSLSGCGGCQGVTASVTVTVGANPGAFKFDFVGDWSDAYGDNTPTDTKVGVGGVTHLTADKPGNNINFPCAGTFNISFYTGAMYDISRVGGACPVAYTKVYPSMFFRQSPGWTSVPMNLIGNNLWQLQIAAPVSGGTTQAKFDVYANWGTNFGDANLDWVAGQNEGNFVVPACTVNGCTMTVRFNDSTKQYAFCQGPVALGGNTTASAALCTR